MAKDSTVKETAPEENLLDFADVVNKQQEVAEKDKERTPELQIVTFLLDKEEYGITISKAREIIKVPDITRVPQTPKHVRGVTNLRGRVIPVVELRTLLGLQASKLSEHSRIIIIEIHDRSLGILVDMVNQVLKIPISIITKPPEEVVSTQTEFISGVARLDKRLVILLNLDRALLYNTDNKK